MVKTGWGSALYNMLLLENSR